MKLSIVTVGPFSRDKDLSTLIPWELNCVYVWEARGEFRVYGEYGGAKQFNENRDSKRLNKQIRL